MKVQITLEIDQDKLWAFAEFLKRVGQDDYRKLASSENEALNMLFCGEAIRDTLRAAGFNPR